MASRFSGSAELGRLGVDTKKFRWQVALIARNSPDGHARPKPILTPTLGIVNVVLPKANQQRAEKIAPGTTNVRTPPQWGMRVFNGFAVLKGELSD